MFTPSVLAAPPRLVGDDYLLQPGQTITFSNLTINSCNADVAGVNIQSEGVDVQSFGNNTGSECIPVNLGDFSITNETSGDQTLRLWLQDNTCSNIYFADGAHAKIGKTKAALNDAGPECGLESVKSTPKGKQANMTVQVSIQ